MKLTDFCGADLSIQINQFRPFYSDQSRSQTSIQINLVQVSYKTVSYKKACIGIGSFERVIN